MNRSGWFNWWTVFVSGSLVAARRHSAPKEIPVCTLCNCLNDTITGMVDDEGDDVGIVIQCSMKSLAHSTLEHMIFPEHIHSLDFRFRGLSSRQSSNMFVRLWGKHVDELHIGRNRIRRLTEGMFKGVETVGFLDISAGGIKSLPHRVFRTLEKLTALWLDLNGISSLEQDMFCGLDNLRDLNLNSNRIKTILPGTFQNLVNLEHLYLDHNKIRHLPSNLFYGLTKLKQLSLASNHLKSMDQGVLAGLVHIDHIDLSRLDSRGTFIPRDLQKEFSKECEPWQLEYGCNPIVNLTTGASHLFNETGTVAPENTCLSASQVFGYTPGTCTEHNRQILCCNGISHLREIFGLTTAYWNDRCCGMMPYSSRVLTCCDNMLFPKRAGEGCCNNRIVDISSHRRRPEKCCDGQVISLLTKQCCNDEITERGQYCKRALTPRLESAYYTWWKTRFVGYVPKSGRRG